ncbi:MAG: hypothetical protein AMXMBFR49_29900 [Chlorobiota bacterium]
MIDSLNVLGDFDGPTLVRSHDGGRTWNAKHTLPPGVGSSMQIVDTLNIFTRTYVNLYKTIDGGASWAEVTLPAGVVSIYGHDFVTPETGYLFLEQQTASGNQRRLLKTRDGGLEWTTLDTTFNGMYGIQFDDEDNGWVFGNSVYRTTDGGATFTVFPTPAGISNVRSVDILGNNIVLGGFRYYSIPPYYNSHIVQTAISTDGGATWAVKDHGSTVEGFPTKIKFINPSTVVVLPYKGILYTTDKGLTWSRGNAPENRHEYSDLKVLNGRVYATGKGANFIVSNPDISTPWDLRSYAQVNQFHEADFTRSGLAVAYTLYGRVFMSRDKGKNWTLKDTPIDVPTSVFISGDSTVYFTDMHKLYKTVDLFSTFDTIADFGMDMISNVRVRGNGEIWLCRETSIITSTDNGQTWQTRYTSTEPYWYDDLQIFDDGTVYAVNGGVSKSTDNGNSWVRLNIPLTLADDIDFYNGRNGYIGKKGEAYYRTTDGGMSFQKLVIPGMSAPQKIHCQDSLNFMLSANELYTTYDGGWMWKVNEFSIPVQYKTFNWMYLFDHFEGIVLGQSKGSLFITSNRGNTPVELSGFSAVSIGNKVALQWTTETETNNMGFEIERRYKHGDWKTIAFSKGSGTSTKRIYYGYDDHEPKAPAILYYRLKQIDYDGRFSYSNEVEVILGEVPENYSINQNYPNPFNPSTKVSFSLPEENEIVIRVFNTMGELVKEINRGILSHGYFDQDIEMGDSPSGIYFCQVFCTNTVSGRTKSLMTKMVLMK